MSRAVLALTATLVLAFAGCGGDDEGGGDGGGGAQAGSPQQVFSDSCGNCHTLSAAGTEGQAGPNLDDLKPDAATGRRASEQGPSVMPENILRGAQADAVAQYVADNAGS